MTEAGFELGFHLQGFDGFHAGMYSVMKPGFCTDHELVVEAVADSGVKAKLRIESE